MIMAFAQATVISDKPTKQYFLQPVSRQKERHL